MSFRTCSYKQQIHHGELWKNNKTIFEIPSSFQIGNCLFLFICKWCRHFYSVCTSVCHSAVYWAELTLVLLSMDSYTCTRLLQLIMDWKPVVYGCLASNIYLKDQSPTAKNDPVTTTKLIKYERLVYICVEQAFLYYMQYWALEKPRWLFFSTIFVRGHHFAVSDS